MSSVTNSPNRAFSNGEESVIVDGLDHLHLPDEQPDAPIQCLLPPELLLCIFSFLSPEELARASGVCRQWHILANDNILWKRFDLKKLFPSLQIINRIDRTVWEKCVDLDAFGLSFKDAEPIVNRTLIPVLKSHFHALAKAKVESNAGWTVVEQPKGLNLNKLMQLATSPKEGNRTPFKFIPPGLVEELGECTVSKTRSFIMTNNVLEGSRGVPFDQQKELVEKMKCEMPGILDAASLIVLTHMDSPVNSSTRLYSTNPLTYTHCYQKLDDCPLMVGGLDQAGLRIFGHIFYDTNRMGVAALLKLSASGD